MIWESGGSKEEQQSVTTEEISASRTAGKCVLVVDDSAVVRHTVASILRHLHLRVLEARDGVEGLKAIAEHGPDLVILDLHMPEKGGLETLTELRADPRFSYLPIFILTSTASASIVRRAAALKVSGYLVKSNLNAADLRARIGSVLGHIPADVSPQRSLGKLNIVLAQGSVDDRQPMVHVLMDWGCTILPTDSGAEVLALVNRETIAAILMDEALVDGSGFDAAEAVRGVERDGADRIPIILLTGQALDSVRDRGAQVGMDAYVAKPVDADELFRTIRDAIALSGGGGPFDRDELMERVGDDIELVQQMLVLYDRDAPRQLAEIERGIETADPEAVANSAHTLKGMLGTLAAHGIAAVAHELEILGKQGDLSQAREKLQSLAAGTAELATALEAEFGSAAQQ